MSLETLLEAAQWVESSSKEKTREDSSRHFHHYAKSPSVSEDNSDGRTEDTREKRRTGGAGTREVHNKLEKNRRAHLKECFDLLKKQIPQLEEKKTSNLGVLRQSLKQIQTLKRQERENELELQRLAQEKSRLRDRFDRLRNELDQLNVKVDLEHFMQAEQDQDSNSTSTATEGPDTPPGSDEEQDVHTPMVPQPVAKAIPHPVIRTVSSVAPAQMVGRRPSASSVPQSPSPQVTPLNLVMTSSANAAATNAVVQPSPIVVRPPVTQLLQQTLEKRQAQNKQQQSGSSQVNTVMSNQAVRQVVKAIPATIPAGVVSFSPLVSLVSAAGGGAKPGSVALPANQAKALSQSLLLTPSSAHNLATAPNHTATTPTVLQAPMGLGGATVITPIRATPNTAAATTATTTGLTTTSNQLSRPLLTAAVQGAAVTTPQVLATGPLAAFGHHQLLTQLQRGTSVSGMGVGVGGLPMVSLGAAGAQIMSPLTVMTPGLGMLSAPLLKQFPLLQQHQLLTNAQVLQTAQQQQPQQSIVNPQPLVIMTAPSVVTTTTATTPAVATGTKVTS